MKRTQLAAAVLLATGSVSAFAATYSVTPLPLQDVAINNFARSIDDSGFMLSAVQSEFNPPINVDQLENDTTFFADRGGLLESEEDVKNGIFSDFDYQVIVEYLTDDNVVRSQGQRLADFRTYLTDGLDLSVVPGLDKVNEELGELTRSVRSIGRDSLNGNFVVGDSSGFVVLDPYENEAGNTINYTYPESGPQAFVQVAGNTKVLAPVDNTATGFASARAVNNNLQIVGFSTVSFRDDVSQAVEACEDDETRTDISVGRCIANVYTGDFAVPRISSAFVNTSTNFIPGYVLLSEVNATVWQIDTTGEVISTETFDLLFEPEEDATGHFYTYGYDINNQGIAVGEALTGETVRITRPNSSARLESERVATVFRDGQTVELLPRDENLQSQAIGINDNNWVVGAVLRATSGTARSRLFAVNLDSQEQRYPDGFFASAGVTANAINNNNIVVGQADIAATSQTLRETAAFMYDIDTEEFVDLNELVSCDNTFELIEAVDINDNNEIIATARIRTTSKFVTGEEVINSAGETVESSAFVSVKLTPIPNGQVDECEVPEDERPFERQGASTGWFSTLVLLGAVLFRRRVRR